jgi:hypothetical protein
MLAAVGRFGGSPRSRLFERPLQKLAFGSTATRFLVTIQVSVGESARLLT